MSEFSKIFKKVNGMTVLKEYAKSHVLLHALLLTLIEGTSKKSLEIVRESVTNKIVNRLRKEYRPFIDDYVKNYSSRARNRSKKVWVCWLQGVENAPKIVQQCVESLIQQLPDREIILLTSNNYKDWVRFPEHIQKKIDSGVITKTHMTDFLRLELLEKYGGTWIDATVFCTGGFIPNYLMDSDFFIYQIMKPGLDGHAARVSTWFITSSTNNPILSLTKELLCKYWEQYDFMLDYFLIHDFIELAIEVFPDEWSNVVPVSSSIPHILLLRLSDKYNSSVWEAAKKMTPFHKLTYKFADDQVSTNMETGTFFNTIFMN